MLIQQTVLNPHLTKFKTYSTKPSLKGCQTFGLHNKTKAFNLETYLTCPVDQQPAELLKLLIELGEDRPWFYNEGFSLPDAGNLNHHHSHKKFSYYSLFEQMGEDYTTVRYSMPLSTDQVHSHNYFIKRIGLQSKSEELKYFYLVYSKDDESKANILPDGYKNLSKPIAMGKWIVDIESGTYSGFRYGRSSITGKPMLNYAVSLKGALKEMSLIDEAITNNTGTFSENITQSILKLIKVLILASRNEKAKTEDLSKTSSVTMEKSFLPPETSIKDYITSSAS